MACHLQPWNYLKMIPFGKEKNQFSPKALARYTNHTSGQVSCFRVAPYKMNAMFISWLFFVSHCLVLDFSKLLVLLTFWFWFSYLFWFLFYGNLIMPRLVSNSWALVVLLSQPPEYVKLYACIPTPGFAVVGFLLTIQGWELPVLPILAQAQLHPP